MLAREIIDEAREFHIHFDEHAHPTTMLLRALHRAEMRFFDLVATIAPGALAVDVVFDEDDLTAALEGTPLELPDNRAVLPLAVLSNANGIFPVSLMQDEESAGGGEYMLRLIGRQLHVAQPAAFLATLSEDAEEAIYNPFTVVEATGLRVSYIPQPAPITSLDATLVSPDDARRFLQAEIVKFMALRDPGMASERAGLITEAAMLQEDVIAFYTARSAAETRW
jgi:hypothetical protein